MLGRWPGWCVKDVMVADEAGLAPNDRRPTINCVLGATDVVLFVLRTPVSG
jgi:hypothetical protein